MDSKIDAVRARLERDLSLRLIHRDTAGDVQALLEHHATLQTHISALPVLIEAVRRLPDAEQVLAQWDKARAVRHG